MRYYFVMDENLSTYYLSGESLLEALGIGKLSMEEVTEYTEIDVDSYINEPVGTPDNIAYEMLSPEVDPNLCPHCETGHIHRDSSCLLGVDYEYCDHCNYNSLPELEEDSPTYYSEPIYLQSSYPYYI